MNWRGPKRKATDDLIRIVKAAPVRRGIIAELVQRTGLSDANVRKLRTGPLPKQYGR